MLPASIKKRGVTDRQTEKKREKKRRRREREREKEREMKRVRKSRKIDACTQKLNLLFLH